MSERIKAGVIGHPIAHSLSPKLHQYWLKQYDINGEYEAYDVAPEELEYFIKTLPEKGFAGCNVTIPHKERAVKYVDSLALGYAEQIGAINTIVIRNGKIEGGNTDYYGFLQNLITHGFQPDKKNVLVIGAGGAARPICVGLLALRCKITLINRTYDKAKDMVASIGGGIDVLPWEEIEEAMHDKKLLVNTTSLGMTGHPPLNISLQNLPESAVVNDIVYSPLETPLLAAAKARGNPVVDGLGMLLHQAVPGFEAWFGVRPEVTDALREHILNA